MARHLLLTLLTDQPPEPEDVTAGWIGAVVMVLLLGAVVFLGFSLTKQLRKAQAAEDAGLYDHDEPTVAPGDSDTDPTPGDESPADNNGEPHHSA